MKRSVKICLLAAAALILLGVLSIGAAMAANHWDLSLLSGTSYVTNTVAINDAFRNISIDCDTEDIVFRTAADGTCSVIFIEEETERHTACVKDGTLSISVTDSGTWYDGFMRFSTESTAITVCLPRGEYDSLFIKESTGDISIPADFTFEDIEIALSTGDVDCGASASGAIRVKASTGKIRMDGVSAGALSLTVTTGRVELRSVDCKGDLELNFSTGKASLTDVSCGRLISGGSTGDIRMENVAASEKISIERSTGDVELALCDAAELQIKTDTGDVSGTLLSEKIFIARSETGRIDVPETTGGGKCAITTNTGDIRIRIE